MSSKTSIAAEEYRLRQWAADIRDCQARPKEMSVVSRCHAHGITKANYYDRLRVSAWRALLNNACGLKGIFFACGYTERRKREELRAGGVCQ